MKDKKHNAEIIADTIIDQLIEAGMDYDQMLKVIQLARKKYEAMKNKTRNLKPKANNE